LYRTEDRARECKVFLAEAGDTSAVKGLLKDVKTAMTKEGPVTELGIGNEGFQGKLFKSLAMVSRREQVVFGCYGTMTDREMKNVIAGIDRRVKPYVPPKIKEKEKEETEEKKGGLGPFTPQL